MKTSQLDPTTPVYKSSNGSCVHLKRHCRQLRRAKRVSRYTAGGMWADTAVCKLCTDQRPRASGRATGMPQLLEDSSPEDFGLGGWP